jgi:hypothetical protein
LVSGHIGSGKTTELLRLEAQTEAAAPARFMALDALSPDGQLSTTEIATALLVALRSMIAGVSIAEAAKSDTFQKVLSRISSALASAVALSVGTGSFGVPSLGSSLDTEQTEQQLVEAVRAAADEVTAQTESPPIVFLDGLDKLSLSEIEPTLARLLTWQLPLSFVATVPLSYLFTSSFSRREAEFAGIHVVPALPVRTREGQLNDAALAWFEQVLQSRGVHELFDYSALIQIATMTAGIIRDFVRSCRDAVLAALVQKRERVDIEMAQIALDDFALRMTRPVSGEDLRLLEVVAKTGRVVGHPTFLALIDGGQIVEYRNGSNWYAVHPLLEGVVREFAEELAS